MVLYLASFDLFRLLASIKEEGICILKLVTCQISPTPYEELPGPERIATSGFSSTLCEAPPKNEPVVVAAELVAYI